MTIEVKHATQAVGTDAGNGEIAKAQWNEAHTINMATGNLLGRSTAGSGAVEEIAIGSGLSLSSGTLSASGGSSTLTIQNKTAAYTVVAGDNGTIINCTANTFTVSLTAAATLGAGFNCWIWNTSTTATHAVTIDPNASETIDGVTTLVLRRGEGAQIICDGTNWQTGDKKTMRGYAENLISSVPRPVASGDMSFAIGGDISGYMAQAVGGGSIAIGSAYASGSNSFAAAVANNTSTYGAQGDNSVAIGKFSKVTSFDGLALGKYSSVSGNSATAIGEYATAGGNGAVAIGRNATTSANYALALSSGINGANAAANNAVALGNGSNSNILGKLAFASVRFAATGDGQSGTFVLVRATTDATATALTTNNAAAVTTNQVILPNNSAYAFTGTVVARQQAAGGTQSAAWKVEGLIRREGSAGTTTLVASTVTAISNAPGWALALSADTTNGGLAITATGAAATNIRWVATIQTSEVTYA